MVGDILLGLIRTSGGANWQLHLFAIGEMFPWYFAYDRLNYAWYLPAYNPQMINLLIDHPQVYQNFSNGGDSVLLADDNPFGRIQVDQATYVTVNKDTQTVGGTTTYCQKGGVVKRYYLSAEHRSAFLGQLRDITQVNPSAIHHSELQKPRIDRDDWDVADVVELIDNWTNSFEEANTLSSSRQTMFLGRMLHMTCYVCVEQGRRRLMTVSNVKGMKKRHGRNSFMIPWEKQD